MMTQPKLDRLVRVVNSNGSTALGLMHTENILERMQNMEMQIMALTSVNSGVEQRVSELELVTSGLQQRVSELESKEQTRVKRINRAKQIVQAALENADAHSPTTEKTTCSVCMGTMSKCRMKVKPCCKCNVDVCFVCYAFLEPVANEIRCPGCRHVLERVD